MQKRIVIRFKLLTCGLLLVTVFLFGTIVSSAQSNSYLDYYASWSVNKCTTTTRPNPLTGYNYYANAVVFEYDSSGSVIDSNSDYQTTQLLSATASASKSGVKTARVVNYLSTGASSSGTSYGYETHVISKGSDIN